MFDIPISKMNDKQLRNAVQLLYDEFAIFRRKYNDAICNLDDDNFSSRFVKEKGDMRTAIEQTAEQITLQAEKITENEESMASLSVSAGKISSIAKTNISAFFELKEVPTKSNTTATQKSILCLYNDKYYYYNDILEEWEEYPEDGLQTMFTQTPDGFELQGNVLIDGDTVITQNLKLSGNVTWDMSNSPVLTQYSSDNVNWHSTMLDGDIYMQMSFDGGKHWSTSTKVVGTDGKNGYNGSDANVTPQNVFDALTDNGANQGIFAAFVNKENQIYINAEYLATQIAKVADYVYIGESGSNDEKRIQFQSGAFISTYMDWTGNPPTGMRISASTLDLSGCSEIYWGNHTIGTATAVFG